MMRVRRWMAALGLLAAAAAPAAAQIAITPTIGAYISGDDPISLADSDRRLVRGNTLGLGANLELGMFRATVAYASGATIEDEGVGAVGDVGEGSLLAVTGGIALRPIPRLGGFQLYGLAGAGVKRFGYSWDDDGVSNAFPEDATDFAVQLGLGADLMLGPLGVVIEVYDMLAPEYSDSRRHDTFLMAGLRLAVGGGSNRP